jgi:hypothetical protein
MMMLLLKKNAVELNARTRARPGRKIARLLGPASKGVSRMNVINGHCRDVGRHAAPIGMKEVTP